MQMRVWRACEHAGAGERRVAHGTSVSVSRTCSLLCSTNDRGKGPYVRIANRWVIGTGDKATATLRVHVIAFHDRAVYQAALVPRASKIF